MRLVLDSSAFFVRLHLRSGVETIRPLRSFHCGILKASSTFSASGVSAIDPDTVVRHVRMVAVAIGEGHPLHRL